MSVTSRWLVSLVLAAGIGAAALAPAPARAGDDLVRILVDVADVVLRGSTPYYRHGSYGRHDRLIAVRDHRGRVTYYREVPRSYRSVRRVPHYRPGPPPHARAWGHPTRRSAIRHYDVRYDRKHRGNRGTRYDRDRRDRRDRSRRGRGW